MRNFKVFYFGWRVLQVEFVVHQLGAPVPVAQAVSIIGGAPPGAGAVTGFKMNRRLSGLLNPKG
jgi:hypothetical protein